jgi:hypothetical protein
MTKSATENFFITNIQEKLSSAARACGNDYCRQIAYRFFKILAENLSKNKAENINNISFDELVQGSFYFHGIALEKEIMEKREELYSTIASKISYLCEISTCKERSFIEKANELSDALFYDFNICYHVPTVLYREGEQLENEESQLWAEWMHQYGDLHQFLISFPTQDLLKNLKSAKAEIKTLSDDLFDTLTTLEKSLNSVFAKSRQSEINYKNIRSQLKVIIDNLDLDDPRSLKGVVFDRNYRPFPEAYTALDSFAEKTITIKNQIRDTDSALFWQSVSADKLIDPRTLWDTFINIHATLRYLQMIATLELIMNFNRMYFFERLDTEIERSGSQFDYTKRNVLTALIQELALHASIKGADHCGKVNDGLYKILIKIDENQAQSNIFEIPEPNKYYSPQTADFLKEFSLFSPNFHKFLIDFLDKAYSCDDSSIPRDFLINANPWTKDNHALHVKNTFSGLSLGDDDIFGTAYRLSTRDNETVLYNLSKLNDSCRQFFNMCPIFTKFYSSDASNIKKSIGHVAAQKYPECSLMLQSLISIQKIRSHAENLRLSGYFSSETIHGRNIDFDTKNQVEQYHAFIKALDSAFQTNFQKKSLNYIQSNHTIVNTPIMPYSIETECGEELETMWLNKGSKQRNTRSAFENFYWGICVDKKFGLHIEIRTEDDSKTKGIWVNCNRDFFNKVSEDYIVDLLNITPKIIHELIDNCKKPGIDSHDFLNQLYSEILMNPGFYVTRENINNWVAKGINPAEIQKNIQNINDIRNELDELKNNMNEIQKKITVSGGLSKAKPHALQKFKNIATKILKLKSEEFVNLMDLAKSLENISEKDPAKKALLGQIHQTKSILNIFLEYERNMGLFLNEQYEISNNMKMDTPATQKKLVKKKPKF